MNATQAAALNVVIAVLDDIIASINPPTPNPERAGYDARLAEANANCTSSLFRPGVLDGLTDAELDNISFLRCMFGVVHSKYEDALLQKYGISLNPPMAPSVPLASVEQYQSDFVESYGVIHGQLPPKTLAEDSLSLDGAPQTPSPAPSPDLTSGSADRFEAASQ